MSHPDQVGLVLDTTAVLGFAMRRMGVREPIEQVADSDQDFGVPLKCLAEAIRREPKLAVEDIVLHPRCVILAEREQDDELVGAYASFFGGRTDLAAARVAANRHNSAILTDESQGYSMDGHVPPDVIQISDKWD